ncbi:MAG: hypothetical protein IJC35_06530 [Oscillospiraceae bacterium]|nr:hypothetical protein [Oscillospiraceae bacterium]
MKLPGLGIGTATASTTVIENQRCTPDKQYRQGEQLIPQKAKGAKGSP